MGGIKTGVVLLSREEPGGCLLTGQVVSGIKVARQQICEGESSDAGHRGGPDRSSCEGPVMGLERRGRVVLVSLAVNRGDAGGAG
jgi:hypothetical protein